MPDSHLPRKFLRLLKPRLPQMLAALRRFVNAESPSLEKTAADRCCGVIAEEWNKHGARVERISSLGPTPGPGPLRYGLLDRNTRQDAFPAGRWQSLRPGNL